MAVTKYSARDVTFQVSDGQATPTWVEVGGVNTFTINRGENEETADTTTFTSRGEYEGQIMQRGASLSLEGFRLLDAANGTLDAGQRRVEAVAGQTGDGSVTQVRFAAPGEAQWEVWSAYVAVGEVGGGNNDKASWAATFTRSGPKTATART